MPRRDKIVWLEDVILRLDEHVHDHRLCIDSGDVLFAGHEAADLEITCNGPYPGNHPTYKFEFVESNPTHDETVCVQIELNERQTIMLVEKIVDMLKTKNPTERQNAKVLLLAKLRDNIGE